MIPSPTDKASYTKRNEYLATPLRKAQNLHLHNFKKKNSSSNVHVSETDITEINSLLIKYETVQNDSVDLIFDCFTTIHHAAMSVELPYIHTSYCST